MEKHIKPWYTSAASAFYYCFWGGFSYEAEKFDWGYFLKHIAIIAIPVALQNLLTTTGSMVDTIMLASIGEKAVGAVGLCAQFSSLMFSGYWGFIGGGMLFFAQYWGAKDHDGITRSYGMTLLLWWPLLLFLQVLQSEYLLYHGSLHRQARNSGDWYFLP